MPATSCRCSLPKSIVSTTSRSALGCGAAAVIVATRRSMVRKSSMLITFLCSLALTAQPVEFHLTAGEAEAEAAGNFGLQGIDASLLELDDLAAAFADQVVVMMP